MKEKSSIRSSFVFSETVNPEMLSAKVYHVIIATTIDTCVIKRNYKNIFIKYKVLTLYFNNPYILKYSALYKTLKNFNLLYLKYTCFSTVVFFFFSCPSTPRKFATIFNDDTNLHQTIFHNVFVYFKSYDWRNIYLCQSKYLTTYNYLSINTKNIGKWATCVH